MLFTQSALEKISEILLPFKKDAYFNIDVNGDLIEGFTWHLSIDTSRCLGEHVPDAQVYLNVDPYITTNYKSYPTVFNKKLDYSLATDEFIITNQ